MGLIRLSHIVALGLLLAGLVVVAPNRAEAAPCGSGADIRDGGGSARGCQQKEDDGNPQKTSSPGASQEAL